VGTRSSGVVKHDFTLYNYVAVGKGRHPKNEINRALKKARKSHFEVVEDHNGHRWGWIVCQVCGDNVPVWGTPGRPGNHAKRLIELIEDDHAHQEEQ